MTYDELSKHFFIKDGVIWKKLNNRGNPNPVKIKGALNKGYLWIRSTLTNGKFIGYHRALWILTHGDIPDGMVVDHINRNTLDNSIDNLRLVTRSQNSMNAKGKAGAKYSKNVYEDFSWKGTKKYRAQVMFDGKVVRVGGYDTIEQAERMAKALRKFLHGEYAIKEGDV